MSIVYSFVARGTTVLAEYQAFFNPEYRQQAIERLKQTDDTDDHFNFFVGDYRYNVLKAQGYVYLVVSDGELATSFTQACLNRIQTEFEKRHIRTASKAKEDGLTAQFGPKIKTQIEITMQNPEQADKVNEIHNQLQEVKLSMSENVNKVVNNIETVTQVQEKTDYMASQAQAFHVDARRAARIQWWRKTKVQVIVAAVIVLVIIIIVVALVTR